MTTALLANPGFQDLGSIGYMGFHLSLVDDDTVHHAVVCCARDVLIPEEPGSRDGDIPFYGQYFTHSGDFLRFQVIASSRAPRDSYHHETYFIFTRHPRWIHQGVYKPFTMSSGFP